MRSRCFAACLALLASLPATAQRTPVPLNDYTRLGQRFTASQPLDAIRVCMPTWYGTDGGVTLTLWDSPERKKELAERVIPLVRDNEMVELPFAKPLAAGTYYWEITNRTGTTRIGLYCDALPADTAECAFRDGKPDPRGRFVMEMVVAPPPPPVGSDLIVALYVGHPDQQALACRQAAIHGTAACVPPLARLLADPQLSHLARYAMEDMPDKSVDAAFEAALGRLSGSLLVGVINSVAVRRDAGAVGRLAELLTSGTPEVASAAAIALGRIGTPAAAAALGRMSASQPTAYEAALYEGCLACAARLMVDGRNADAMRLYDRLRSPAAPRAVQTAAARGAVLARGPAGLVLLRQLLHRDDPDLRGVALWIAQHELPGSNVTLGLASELERLPADSQALLLTALAGRGDPAALPALELASAKGDKSVRLAAIVGLPRFGGAAAPGLLGLLDDPDPELRQGAQNGLAGLPAKDAAAVATGLLQNPAAARRRSGIALIQRRLLPGFGARLAAALRDPSPEVRLDAAKALAELAGAPGIPALRDALVASADGGEAEAVERALSAACGRAGDPEAVAGQLLAGMEQAAPPRRAALVRVLGTVGGARALGVVRDALAGPAGEVRNAALDVLCAWPTEAAAPDLLRLARDPAAPAEGLKCLRGVLRLAASPDIEAGRRLQLCRDAGGLVQRDEEWRLLLGALGGTGSFDALDLVMPHLEAPATREEACAAVLGLAEKLVALPEAARLAGPLEQVARLTTNPDFAQKARALLEQAKPGK
ncbi:MAG: hypothetical protein HYU66_26195 [Armatimonadetes bacterium]|nr:hypothetical protein [Armatimonadota bacterium]